MHGADPFVLNEWKRCGNTLFYVRTRHHEIEGYTFINPADFIQVKWEATPEGYQVVKLEVPSTHPKEVSDAVEASLQTIQPELTHMFYSWMRIYDVLKNDKKSSAKIVSDFANGYDERQKNLALDAFEKGFFRSPIHWVKDEAIVPRETLNETLSDFGVMECPEGQIS